MLMCETESGNSFAIMLAPHLRLIRQENDKLIFFDSKLNQEVEADLPM